MLLLDTGTMKAYHFMVLQKTIDQCVVRVISSKKDNSGYIEIHIHFTNYRSVE